MAFGELAIEWVAVPDTSPAIGKTLAECAFRQRTGITIIAILREPEPVAGAQPNDVIQQGDTLVTVGKLGQYPPSASSSPRGPSRTARAARRPPSDRPSEHALRDVDGLELGGSARTSA